MSERLTFVFRKTVLSILFSLLISCTLLLISSTPLLAETEPTDGTILFLPLITNGNTQAHSPNNETCAANVQESRVAELLHNDAGQGRAALACDPVLAAVAREKARDMASRNYFDHTNPDGAGPNFLIQQAGYRLPASYSQSRDGNNVESIAAGFESAEGAWDGWLNSDHHRPHVLGEIPFFAEQTEYGVGYFYDPNSFYHHYWVILTAHAD